MIPYLLRSDPLDLLVQLGLLGELLGPGRALLGPPDVQGRRSDVADDVEDLLEARALLRVVLKAVLHELADLLAVWGEGTGWGRAGMMCL